MRVLQRFYLVEVLSGVALTTAHFFRNMGRHAAHALGKKDARGAVTIQYPDERRPYSPRLRTLHRLVIELRIVGHDPGNQPLKARIPVKFLGVDLAVRHHHPAEISRPSEASR